MEGLARRVCSWLKESSYYSSRILAFVCPLLLVSVLLAFMGSSSSGPYSWVSVLPPGDGLRRPPVARGGTEEALMSTEYSLNRSAEPPLAVEDGPANAYEAEKEEEDLMNTTNGFYKEEEDLMNATNGFPAVNKSDQVLPWTQARIKNPTSLQILEAKLNKARASIQNSSANGTYDIDYVPNGPIYWNPGNFHRSYLEMERQFKVYVYEEGEHPIFHNGPCGSIYSMEGNFIYKIESTKFRTRDPESAHVFFLPFSVASIVHFIFNRTEKDHWIPMKQTVKDYVNLVAMKYPYWNRSLGSDHFMLACHDWGPELSKSVPELFTNSIRALCNANKTEGFRPAKDVSIPEINLLGGRATGLVGGPSPSKRPILVFFAGGLHGPIRPILLQHWMDKDEDVQVHKYLPKNVSYSAMMRKSKYCICPSGYEVASPRMVEALYMGCVPVLMKDGYVAPFSDVLNWKSFSVEISVEDIPKMKEILLGISTSQYIRMQRRGVQARRHFEVNLPPKRYDVFHMTLHSIWLRRLNIRLHGIQDS